MGRPAEADPDFRYWCVGVWRDARAARTASKVSEAPKRPRLRQAEDLADDEA